MAMNEYSLADIAAVADGAGGGNRNGAWGGDGAWWIILLIALLGLILCVIQFAVGRYVGHFFGRTVEAGQALGQKNTAFAIWIAYTYLNPLSSVGPGCYILWQNCINSIELWQRRKEEAS